MSDHAQFHIVVPCYHESGRIGHFLPSLCEKLDQVGGCRVMIAEDGSGSKEQSRMSEIVQQLKPKYACLSDPLMQAQNTGKGGAVYAGWSQHQGAEWLGFVDADGSITGDEAARLIRLARERGAERGAIIASRISMLGRDVRRDGHRHIIGRVFATFVSELLHIPVYDSQCGFKLVPRAAYERVASLLTIKGFAFDVQLLAALLDSGCPVIEVPIDWHEVAGSKTSLLRDLARMFAEVLKVRRQRQTKEWQEMIAQSPKNES